MKEYAFGIDLGGTTAKVGLFTTSGALLEKWEVPTDTSNAGEHILENLADAIHAKMAEKEITSEQVEGVGIGVPGPVLDSRVVPIICANLGGWGERNVSAQLSGLLDGMKVLVGNDANVAALGEIWMGTAKGCRSAVMVTLGTGVGGGVIGSSWAIQYALKGLHVTLYDINDQQLTKSHDQMLRSLDALVAHNAITAARKDEIIACVRPTTSMEEAVQDAQFIQESGPERIEIKRSILAQVEQYAAPDALYASSTSGLLISDIVAEALHPERCIGAHPYNPPHLIPLVELTRCDKTDDDCVQLAYDFYQSIGKEAVLLRKECPGFIANRLQLALYREVQDLVMRGVCSVEDVDKALVYGPGIRWAIFGHNMIMQMGNPGGLTGMVEMLGNSGDHWLEDMASWTHQPDNWAQVAQPGVDQEMANFPDYIGHTNAECIAYRDQMLIDILKLHKKL